MKAGTASIRIHLRERKARTVLDRRCRVATSDSVGVGDLLRQAPQRFTLRVVVEEVVLAMDEADACGLAGTAPNGAGVRRLVEALPWPEMGAEREGDAVAVAPGVARWRRQVVERVPGFSWRVGDTVERLAVAVRDAERQVPVSERELEAAGQLQMLEGVG